MWIAISNMEDVMLFDFEKTEQTITSNLCNAFLVQTSNFLIQSEKKNTFQN